MPVGEEFHSLSNPVISITPPPRFGQNWGLLCRRCSSSWVTLKTLATFVYFIARSFFFHPNFLWLCQEHASQCLQNPLRSSGTTCTTEWLRGRVGWEGGREHLAGGREPLGARRGVILTRLGCDETEKGLENCSMLMWKAVSRGVILPVDTRRCKHCLAVDVGS